MLTIEVTREQDTLAVNQQRLRQVAAAILREAGVREGALSIAIVNDPTIHALNRQYLQHDYATDVLSFLLEREGDHLEGEVIVSNDTAARTAERLGWPAEDELLLYVVHGTLHLVGYDDATDALRTAMQDAERRYLAQFGVERRDEPAAHE